jgi:hypothetical protein
MSKNKQHHVQPHDDGGWEVKKSESDRASRVLPTKREAEKIGRDISKNQGTELVIHRSDGTIERKDSHGNDPNPPKDKK